LIAAIGGVITRKNAGDPVIAGVSICRIARSG
jgi:hypothetical protein